MYRLKLTSKWFVNMVKRDVALVNLSAVELFDNCFFVTIVFDEARPKVL